MFSICFAPYECIHTYKHKYVHACMHACMDACMHACMHACMRACLQVCMPACMDPSCTCVCACCTCKPRVYFHCNLVCAACAANKTLFIRWTDWANHLGLHGKDVDLLSSNPPEPERGTCGSQPVNPIYKSSYADDNPIATMTSAVRGHLKT